MNSQTNEEKSTSKETRENKKSRPSNWSDDMSRMMNACCMGGEGSGYMMGSMGRCCKSFMGGIFWFSLIVLIFAGSALVLGYYLSPDSVRVLWMVGWGTVIGIGIICLISMRIFFAKLSFRNCCGQRSDFWRNPNEK